LYDGRQFASAAAAGTYSVRGYDMPDHEILPPFSGSAVPHVGTYRRVLPVNLERMYENALDWEHLPFVHRSSFSAITCVDAGSWGWRAQVTSPNGTVSLIELRLDRVCRRWITRNLEGPNKGAEIWTHVFTLEPKVDVERLEIVVDFFVPGVTAEAREKVGRGYAKLYATLYDEDVAMMVERQKRLDRRMDGSRTETRRLLLGRRSDLQLPMQCAVSGRDYIVLEDGGELVVIPALCPHQLGPLQAKSVAGIATCSWHGYRFDVRTGDCVSGQSCRLSNIPVLSEDDGEWTLTAQPGG
jgi:nitrite reductase/ring-hydroxylating ferredoxin subunit